MNWTTEQILKLSPDAASAKAARGLLNPKKWSGLGTNERAVWGLCQGSGSKPYQAQIDLSEPAFKCSCPSRKFPCKHGLALFLLLAEQLKEFNQSSPPEWVAKWIESRSGRAAKKEAKELEASKAPADPEAQAKTAAKRLERVKNGVADSQRWLEDFVRTGVAQASSKDPAFWENAAARLVDAQAPGLARLVRELSILPSLGAGWQERMIEHAARLHLLLEGFQRIESLPEDVQSDMRALIGWTEDQDELKRQPGISDEWTVLGQRTELEDRLQVQRCWLKGRQSMRAALLLTFAYGNQAPFSGLMSGTCFEGELVFFPGRLGLRALLKTRSENTRVARELSGGSLTEEIIGWSEFVARHPWLQRYPMSLSGVIPMDHDGAWRLIGSERHQVTLHPHFQSSWNLAALGGGHPIDVFGEWDGDYLMPLSAVAEGRFVEFES